MQNPPIAHRDIKIENILKFNNKYKLCDFGSASTSILNPKKEDKAAIVDNFSNLKKPLPLCIDHPKCVICIQNI